MFTNGTYMGTLTKAVTVQKIVSVKHISIYNIQAATGCYPREFLCIKYYVPICVDKPRLQKRYRLYVRVSTFYKGLILVICRMREVNITCFEGGVFFKPLLWGIVIRSSDDVFAENKNNDKDISIQSMVYRCYNIANEVSHHFKYTNPPKI